jgi:hypothetical protein
MDRLMLLHNLIGYGAADTKFAVGDAALLTLTGYSYFGDMTSQSGNAAAYNGGTNATVANSAYKVGGSNAYAGVNVGPTLAIRPSSVTFYAATTSGFAGSSISELTWSLYGSHSSPASGTDGTLLGTTATITDANNATGTIASFADITFWEYVWARSAIITGSADDWILSEVAITGWLA